MAQRLLFSIVLVAVSVSPAAADPTFKLSASGTTYSYACKGDDWLVLEGNRNELTVTGECAVVEVTGSDNRITIESVATIRISGNNNDVRYERAGKGKPKPAFKIKGSANTVRRGE